MRYRVTIEAIDTECSDSHKVEFVGEANNDDAHTLGVLIAGAIHGICCYDEPNRDACVASLLWRMHFESDFLNAVGHVAKAWECDSKDNRTLDQVCRVVVLKDFFSKAIYAAVVDELPPPWKAAWKKNAENGQG